jgi:hypothetical protein
MELYNDGIDPIIYKCLVKYNTEYDAGNSDFTTTGLDQPSWMRALLKKHKNELKLPASKQLYQLLGLAVHKMLEDTIKQSPNSSNNLPYFIEKRFFHKFKDYVLSGQIDLYDKKNDILKDYKVCSVWEYINGFKNSKSAQANINAWLLRKHGFAPKKIGIVAYFRDFSINQVGIKNNYPPKMETTVFFDIWSDEKVEKYISKRIKAHENPTPCTAIEKWSKVALMKKEKTKAIKLFDSEEECRIWMAQHISNSELPYVFIKIKQGKRCENYCNVSKFCKYKD